MQDTKSILDTLCAVVFKEHLPAYFITENTGLLSHWGGNIEGLNIPSPQKGDTVSDILIFMEGILPLDHKSMEFSCIQLPSGACVDAIVHKQPQGYGIIIWDATPKKNLLTETQQKCNELSLLIESQKRQMGYPRALEDKDDLKFYLADFFKALNFAVLEMNSKGQFRLFAAPPPWFDLISQSKELKAGQPHEEDPFSFLGNFIQEAKERWGSGRFRSIKSGLWIEKDHTGKEYLFEATALAIHGRKLLIISNEVCNPEERQTIIQKGRNLALHYHKLQRSGRELRTMKDELEIMVKARTRDLEQVNLQLSQELEKRKQMEKERAEIARQLRQAQKMEAIGTLAGGVAHDFNNILAGIIGFTELSISETDHTPELQSRLKKILEASNRAKDLVRQILTFSHQTEHGQTPVLLKSIVDEALTLLQASLPPSIDIQQNLESDARILADQTQMHQIIMNLCTNAWHAMKYSGGTIEVGLKKTSVEFEQLVHLPELSVGDYLCLTIKDSGCGIPDTIKEKIFDPYFTTKGKDKGTGLGLSVVHGIVSKSNGCITFESKEGKGSLFSVYFPVLDETPEVKKKKEDYITGKGENILFVDDESFQTEMAHDLLVRMGYKAVTCNSGQEALNLLKNEDCMVDLVITDMVMPGMSGMDLAKKILEFNPSTPIILCSGYSAGLTQEKIAKAGISCYLSKPVGMKELAKSINSALSKTPSS
ncbi:MAG: response regulator [Desulfobacterales bacterium]|nr:response regulator [Desulfobacterales bacterium]